MVLAVLDLLVFCFNMEPPEALPVVVMRNKGVNAFMMMQTSPEKSHVTFL